MALLTSIPKYSKSTGTQKKNLVLTLKTCADEKTYYRFRLLAFSSDGLNDRDDIWITRFMHQIWGTNKEKGYPVIEDEVVCPVTPHVHVEGNRYDACKICSLAGKYFNTYKESNYKDKDANKKNKLFSRKFQAIIPVYVVNDPNYDANNGKFRVIIFNDKKFYTEFRSKIEKQALKANIFNGGPGLDCCIHVGEEEVKYYEGQPNEYTFKRKKIDKVVFATTLKEYPAITAETTRAMGYDDEYYTSSSPEEIDAFYKKYCVVSNDDIPEDDAEEINVFTEDKPSVTARATVNANTVVNANAQVETSESLLNDIDLTDNSSSSSNANVNVQSDNNIVDDDFLKDLGI